MPDRPIDGERILELGAGFMPACIISAAAELGIWSLLAADPLSAEQVASRIEADLRGATILLDAVAALGLLEKRDGRYRTPPSLVSLLTAKGEQTILPMLWHRAALLRGWAQLSWTVRAGFPAPRSATLRGPEADRAAFIAAMHSVSAPIADSLAARIVPPGFRHLLDVGGASGTWTLAFLRAAPQATATIVDLPDAIEQARQRVARSEWAERITLVAGDFYVDPLPPGADFAWLGAIAHQHSRRHNQALLAKVHAALEPGGRVALRDVVMESDRLRPLDGALFAVNMLVNTTCGGTFTFEEFAEDLQAAGFERPTWRVKQPGMNNVIEAFKP